MTEDNWQALLVRQEALEAAGTAAGAERFRKRLAHAEAIGVASTQGAARQLLATGLTRLEAVLRDSIMNPRVSDTPCRQRKTAKDSAGSNKGRGYPASREWLQLVGPNVAAYLVLRAIVDRTASGQAVPLINMAVRVTDALTDELRYRRLKALAPGLFNYTMTQFQKAGTNHTRQIRASMNTSVSYAQIDVSDLDLDDRERVKVGCQCIDLVFEALDWFTVEQEAQHKGKRSPKRVIRLTPEVCTALQTSNDALALRKPVLGPMVVPPLPWAPGQRGGYRFALAQKHALLTNVRQKDQNDIAQARMPAVYSALNAIQETSWRVNTAVLGVVEEIRSLGGGFAGLPLSEDVPLPPKPEDIGTNEVGRKLWRRAAHAIETQNRLRRRKFDKVGRILAVANDMRDEDAIWFPHHLDFRGRVYPLTSYLNPQGDDLSRALLTFVDAKPVDAEARRWLAIHGANALGVAADGRKLSQMTLDERAEHVSTIADQILRLAADPISCPALLLQADKPWQFLAFAFEWSNLAAADMRGEVYASSLPLQMDGSANGIQHYAALLRDEAGAKAVNVTPQSRPSDVYGIVAAALLDRLKTEAITDPRAAQWVRLHETHEIISRKLTKSPCMTFAYGSRRYGFRQQMFDYLVDRDDASAIAQHFVTDADEPEWKALSIACNYLAGVVLSVLSETVAGAAGAMTWLQSCAKSIAKTGIPVSWVTPLGLPIKLPYFKQSKFQIRSVLGGRAVTSLAYRDTPAVSVGKQTSGLAPSVVHSLDATHLMMTVNACVDLGIESFLMIHDSYGVCAADAGAMARALREQFAVMYSVDAAGDLYRQFAAQCSPLASCPHPPTRSSLDVNAVRDSLYFFA